MKNAHLLLLLGVGAITSCQSAKEKEAAAWRRTYQAEQSRIQDESRRMDQVLIEAKAKFSERHKRYECSHEDVPQTDEFKGPGSRFKSMQLGDHVLLKLRLGKAIHLNGEPFGPTRTESRYQLLRDNRLAAEAESLFSTGSEGGTNRIFYNPKDHTLVVFDGLCWSTSRFLVFQKPAGSGRTPSWTTRYFWIPDPPSNQLFPDMGHILGVGNGSIYVEINGQAYAFPFGDFPVEKLEFTVG